MIQIMIVDDHPLFIHGISSLLYPITDIKIVHTTNSGSDALKYSRDLPALPVVLLDFNMPQSDGLKTAEQLLQMHPKSKILLMAMHKSQTLLFQAFELGVGGLWQKNDSQRSLVEAIRLLSDEATYYGEEFFQEYQADSHPIEVAYQPKPLELELLHWLVREYPLSEIALKLEITRLRTLQLWKQLIQVFKVNNSVGLIRIALANKWIEW